jgi:DNA-directed RNA polymerase specialized sigma24 family protein
LILFTSDREIACDAVAEAFAQAIAAREGLHSPQAWVWRAAFRIAAGDLKRRSERGATTHEDSYVMPEPVIDVVRALSAPAEAASEHRAPPLRGLPHQRGRSDDRFDRGGRHRPSLRGSETTEITPGGQR